ncbi:MAG: NifU family protein [Candidatus Sabulitectum sp.]|nr:NifU family protein [Candidatus Sabulitectum sp.]
MSDILAFNEENVRAKLEEVRPMLQADGGDIEFVAIKDKVVQVRLQGSCSGCAFAAMTLQFGVEKSLKKYFPDMERVENVQ